MKVVVVANQKGGVGKSTIACNLSVEASKEGMKVLIIDADTQQSSIDFRAIRPDNEGTPQFHAVSITKNTIHKDIKSFKDFDVIFIDAGGRDSAVFRSAILASDLLIIPVLPSQYDIWATQETIKTFEEANTFKNIEARFILNQVIPNTTVAREALGALEDFNINLLNTRLHSRVVYKQSVSEGKGVTEYDPESKAAKEIKELWKEVKSLCL